MITDLKITLNIVTFLLWFDLQAFTAFDREGVGLISKDDLHQIINAFCFVMSNKQFQVKHCFKALTAFRTRIDVQKKFNTDKKSLRKYDFLC